MTLTVREKLAQDVGKTVFVSFEDVKIECKIVNAAFQYGNERYQIEPLRGQGTQWVNKSRITWQ